MLYTFEHPLLLNDHFFSNLADGAYRYAVIQHPVDKVPLLAVHRITEKDFLARKARVGYVVERYRQQNGLNEILVYGGGSLEVTEKCRSLKWETSSGFGSVPIAILMELISTHSAGKGVLDQSSFALEKPKPGYPHGYLPEYFLNEKITL